MIDSQLDYVKDHSTCLTLGLGSNYYILSLFHPLDIYINFLYQISPFKLIQNTFIPILSYG